MEYCYKTQNTCGRRLTSCVDQLACAVREAYKASIRA